MLRNPRTANPKVTVVFSLFFGILAYGIIHYCATSDQLPQTMFPDSLITRPWDVGPLLLFIFAGLYVFPRFYKKKPSIFSHALIYCCVPEAAVEFHMAFGSTSLFDNHFNIAHFLKIFAYVVPFFGLLLEYVQTYQQEQESVENLEETKKELIQSEKETQAVVENVVDGIITINDQGIIEKFNMSAQKIFGYTSQEAVGGNITLIIPESYRSRYVQGMQVFRDTGQAKIFGQTLALEGLRKNGTVFPLELAVNKLELEDRVLFVGIVRDISERKKTEETIKIAKIEAESANRAKSEFLANMSHEIRTPMNAILGYAQLLQRRDLEKDEQNFIVNILSSGDHLLALIDNILDISKIEAGRMEVSPEDFDLTQLIESLTIMFRPKCDLKHLAFKVKDLGPDPIWVTGDETKIKQVLINLLGNAVKFTESGEVRLNVSAEENDQYRFDIIDTGQGIPQEAHENIFDPFRQDTAGQLKGGTGLGLAIARRQVELLEGKLDLVSDIGKGAQFSLTLKLPPAEQALIVPADEGYKGKKVKYLAPGYNVTALVVDDARMNRDVLAQILEAGGIRVITAENGQEALNLVRKFVPDIVFMDLRMPVMNGIEATRIIKNEYSDEQVKVVAISASVYEKQRIAVAESGADYFISKPFRAENLFGCIKELLKIEYEYEEEKTVEGAKPKGPEIDLSKIHISRHLQASLKEAAELYNITSLEKLLLELGKDGGDGKALAEYLQTHAAQYDMESILNILEKIKNE